MLQRGADFRIKDMGRFDISHDVFNAKINKEVFPEVYEWQRKCQEFLLAHGMKDPGPLKPKKRPPKSKPSGGAPTKKHWTQHEAP